MKVLITSKNIETLRNKCNVTPASQGYDETKQILLRNLLFKHIFMSQVSAVNIHKENFFNFVFLRGRATTQMKYCFLGVADLIRV